MNAELKMNNDSERQKENVMALDVKMKMRLWTPTVRCGFERQTEYAAQNVKLK